MSREMKDSGIAWIGKVPTNWTICKVKNGFTRKNSKAMIENPVVLSLARAGVKVRDLSNNDGQIAESYYNYNPVTIDDLLLNPMDLYSGANCSISKVEGVISPAYINLRYKKGYNPKFYDYYFKTQYWAMAMFAHGKGVSFDNRWTMNAETLMNYYIPYPNIEEQQKIANFLDEKVGEIDKVIAKTKDSIEEYHNLEKAIIQEAVTKGLDSNCSLVDSGVKYIGLIPENWDVKRVKYIASSILKGNGITKDEVIKNGNIQCIRYGEIYTKYKTKILETISRTNYEQISSPKQIEKGDILCAATGELVEEIGKNVVYMGDDKCLAGGDIIIVKHNQNPEYLNYALNSIGSQEQKSLGKTKLKVIHISASEIGDIKVALPNLIEQQEIVDYLNKKCKEIELLIENKSKIISDLEKYKKSLIYEYVTGKREVR